MKMKNIVQMLSDIRGINGGIIDAANDNRYRVTYVEEDGSKTAYYFGVPIYNGRKGGIIDPSFRLNGNGIFFTGSNSKVSAREDSVLIEKINGSCLIGLPAGMTLGDDGSVSYPNTRIYPALNGIACIAALGEDGRRSFRIEVTAPFFKIKNNGKYMALMREKFIPFLTVSAIGALGEKGNVIAPAKLECKKLGEKIFELSFSVPNDNKADAKEVMFEMNMQESKLIQDTTVESKNPKATNAFGGVAFVGNSEYYGEQWMYSRPDYSKLGQIFAMDIEGISLYIPRLDESETKLRAYRVATRFCSFGSNWENKRDHVSASTESEILNGYQKLDLTEILTYKGWLDTRSEGWIIKSAERDKSYAAVATADSFCFPQIMEIRFKK